MSNPKAKAVGRGRGRPPSRGRASALSSQVQRQVAPVGVDEVPTTRRGRGLQARISSSSLFGGRKKHIQPEMAESFVEYMTQPFSPSTQGTGSNGQPTISSSSSVSSYDTRKRSHPMPPSISDSGFSPCLFEEESLSQSETQVPEEDLPLLECGQDLMTGIDTEAENTFQTEEHHSSEDMELNVGAFVDCREEEDEEADFDDDVVDKTYQPPAHRGSSSSGEDSNVEIHEKEMRECGSQAARVSTQRGRCGSAGGGKVTQERIAATSPQVLQPSCQRAKTSLVWAFFNVQPDNECIAICTLCNRKISRGPRGSHLGTSSLNLHLKRYHQQRWDRYKAEHGSSELVGTTSTSCPSSASSPSLNPLLTTPPLPLRPPIHTISGDGDDDGRLAGGSGAERHSLNIEESDVHRLGTSVSSSPSISSTEVMAITSLRSVQSTLPQMFEKYKHWTPSHPQATQLTTLLAKLLALQLVPFKLVDSEPFRELMACACPRYKVPSRYYFSRTAVPALHQHAVTNIVKALDYAVGSKVHLTMDGWTSKHGQGCYVSFTAHWLALTRSGQTSMHFPPSDLVEPPRGVKGQQGCSSTPTCSSASMGRPSASSSSSSSTLQPAACMHPVTKRQRHYGAVQPIRCQAVLNLVSLEGKRHTSQELLSALEVQVGRWLTPSGLNTGYVVSDNGANILAALNRGHLTHIPCFAHVLNLVVQKFLKTYPGVDALLKQARRICAHFHRSPTKTAILTNLQRQNNLPCHRLICDTPTRWNSTLHMVERLYEQRRVINLYLAEHITGTGPAANLGYFQRDQWMQMAMLSKILAPFEQATKLVSQEHSGLNDVIPLIFLLERTLCNLMDIGEGDEEVEVATTTQPPPLPGRGATLQSQERDTLQNEEEDVAEEGEDDMWEDLEDATQGSPSHILSHHRTCQSGIVRLREEPEEEEDEEDDNLEARGFSQRRGHLFNMAHGILRCFRRQRQVKNIKERDDYWMATLLDPRYKNKFGQFLNDSSKETILLNRLTNQLAEQLWEKHRHTIRATENPQSTSSCSTTPNSTTTATNSARRRTDLIEVWNSFFRPPPSQLAQAYPSHRQRLTKMAQEYVSSFVGMEVFQNDDPLEFWASRLDLFPELAQHAMEILACPSSSVLSERVFSAAGGVVTDHRTTLSPQNVNRLTFLKINERWLEKQFHTPIPDAVDVDY